MAEGNVWLAAGAPADKQVFLCFPFHTEPAGLFSFLHVVAMFYLFFRSGL